MTNSEKIRRKALSLGFDLCGIARCRPLERQFDRFKDWLADGCDGGLGYLRRNVDKRFDPAALCADARSMIVCGVGYHRPPSAHAVASRIASYAHARDYHLTIRERLNELLAYLRELVPAAAGRVFTDTAPLAEKSWAVEAGLGWIGRNSLLANPRLGSFLLLGEVVTTAELEPDAPFVRDGCGTCRACVDACPVAAIRPDRTIDAGRCISRRTIEAGGGDEGDLHGWLFGCDVCQRACPYNRKAPVSVHDFFVPLAELERLDIDDWLRLDEAGFRRIFGETPLARCGLRRLQERIRRLK